MASLTIRNRPMRLRRGCGSAPPRNDRSMEEGVRAIC